METWHTGHGRYCLILLIIWITYLTSTKVGFGLQLDGGTAILHIGGFASGDVCFIVTVLQHQWPWWRYGLCSVLL